jgi:hypothetical protein
MPNPSTLSVLISNEQAYVTASEDTSVGRRERRSPVTALAKPVNFDVLLRDVSGLFIDAVSVSDDPCQMMRTPSM